MPTLPVLDSTLTTASPATRRAAVRLPPRQPHLLPPGRNVLPGVAAPGRRLLAPGLIGTGDSDSLTSPTPSMTTPATSTPGSTPWALPRPSSSATTGAARLPSTAPPVSRAASAALPSPRRSSSRWSATSSRWQGGVVHRWCSACSASATAVTSPGPPRACSASSVTDQGAERTPLPGGTHAAARRVRGEPTDSTRSTRRRTARRTGEPRTHAHQVVAAERTTDHVSPSRA